MTQDCTTCLFRSICADDTDLTWRCADHGHWNWTAAATNEPRREDGTATTGEAGA